MARLVWLTTAPDPNEPRGTYAVGQRGWKRHVVHRELGEAVEALTGRPALCGLKAKHGWGVDRVIEDKCVRCERAVQTIMSQMRSR